MEKDSLKNESPNSSATEFPTCWEIAWKLFRGEAWWVCDVPLGCAFCWRIFSRNRQTIMTESL